MRVYIFIEFDPYKLSAKGSYLGLVALPTEIKTKLVELFRSIAGSILRQHLDIRSIGWAEAIYLLLTKGFKERRFVDGYCRHVGATTGTSETQQ